MSITLGQHRIEGGLFLAPMAGVTDAAFRSLCRSYGADYAVSEMLAADASLRHTRKSRQRLIFSDDDCPRAVQILGADPALLADAFDWVCDQGAQVVDFNMGCPAKKVCNVACGSALMRDEKQAAAIIEALGKVSAARAVPVTLKCRTGWDDSHTNVVTIAKMAQDAGFAMVTVHGRSRAGGYTSAVNYSTIAEVVRAVDIPVVANGDITDANRAAAVLKFTKAAALMIGRGALGRPWVFQQIRQSLETGECSPISMKQKVQTVLKHWALHHAHYDAAVATLSFRKHLLWYLADFEDFARYKAQLCSAKNSQEQYGLLVDWFSLKGWM